MLKNSLVRIFRSILAAKNSKAIAPQYDMVFVIFEQSRGWILEAICREIATYLPGTCAYHYSAAKLPPAKAYFFAHYSFLKPCLKSNPWLKDKITLVWFTHPRFDIGNSREIFSSLKEASVVLSPCTHNFDFLMKQGVPKEKLSLILGAADPNMFLNHERSAKGVIGFSSAYYERKRPDRIIGLMEALPEYSFILLGKGWLESPFAEKIKSLKNLNYVECDYKDYPKYYSQMDVFVAPSDIEGGPIPLIEAMMSNVVPVACDTGFARDVIVNEKNGYIFARDAELSEIIALVKKAVVLEGDIRSTVQHLSWEYFSQQVQKHIYSENSKVNSKGAVYETL